MSHSARKAFVREILENASAYEWTLDRLGVLRLSLEAGGPGGIVTWSATGMRDRARRTLEEAGLLSPGAHRRAAAETEYGLRSVLGL